MSFSEVKVSSHLHKTAMNARNDPDFDRPMFNILVEMNCHHSVPNSHPFGRTNNDA